MQSQNFECNKAAHGDQVSSRNAEWLLHEAWNLGRWLYASYANGDPASLKEFQ